MYYGDVAQLGEHHTGSVRVRGSSPSSPPCNTAWNWLGMFVLKFPTVSVILMLGDFSCGGGLISPGQDRVMGLVEMMNAFK